MLPSQTVDDHALLGSKTDMTISRTIPCACRQNHLDLTFRGGIPTAVVDRVFCPLCRENGFDTGRSFPIQGGWYLHFDLEIARMFAMAKLGIDPSLVNPGFILDGRYVEACPNGT
ncbi:MAG: hypothetical protein V2J11_06040 [Desulfofustis sp.]|jgi:hypothetical protein|nr:hypothetical protein [Desulfofustis sp.]